MSLPLGFEFIRNRKNAPANLNTDTMKEPSGAPHSPSLSQRLSGWWSTTPEAQQKAHDQSSKSRKQNRRFIDEDDSDDDTFDKPVLEGQSGRVDADDENMEDYVERENYGDDEEEDEEHRDKAVDTRAGVEV